MPSHKCGDQESRPWENVNICFVKIMALTIHQFRYSKARGTK